MMMKMIMISDDENDDDDDDDDDDDCFVAAASLTWITEFTGFSADHLRVGIITEQMQVAHVKLRLVFTRWVLTRQARVCVTTKHSHVKHSDICVSINYNHITVTSV